jgi:hypothetical protein
MPLNNARPGVLILDVLIGVAVFSIIVSGVIYTLLLAQHSTLKSGDQIRATHLNQQLIAGVKSIRDTDFASVTEGTFGVKIGESGLWELSGTGTVSSEGFISSVEIVSIDSNRAQVTATTTWDFGAVRVGESSLVTDITDWHRTQAASDWSSISLDGAYIDAGTPLFNSAVATDDYVFVTSETSDGGAGLYVFDISDTSSPTRVASSFALGAAGYDILIVGTDLYVVTDDTGAEIQIFDITSPSTLSAGNRTATINVPGSSKARSIVVVNDTLYIASLEDSTEAEFFSYDVSDLGSIAMLDDLEDTGSSHAQIVLHNGYAYTGNSNDLLELRVVDAFDPSDLQFAVGEGYNVPDIPNGTSVAAFGEYILLGRLQGDLTEELHLFDVSESPVPSAAPSNAEAGQSVNALDAEPTGTYAFAATEHDNQELLVLDIDLFAGGDNPITEVWDTGTGLGRGVMYNASHDRVFLMTNTAVILLKPA